MITLWPPAMYLPLPKFPLLPIFSNVPLPKMKIRTCCPPFFSFACDLYFLPFSQHVFLTKKILFFLFFPLCSPFSPFKIVFSLLIGTNKTSSLHDYRFFQKRLLFPNKTSSIIIIFLMPLANVLEK